MATYTVQRSKWYRGQGSQSSKLLREDGMRCCIGFVAHQCGIPDASILSEPAVVNHIYSHPGEEGLWPAWMLDRKKILDAYLTNDNWMLSHEDRESELTAIFANQGDTLLFVD